MNENLQASCEMNQESTAGHKSLNVESQTFHQTREQVQAYNHKILVSQLSVGEKNLIKKVNLVRGVTEELASQLSSVYLGVSVRCILKTRSHQNINNKVYFASKPVEECFL